MLYVKSEYIIFVILITRLSLADRRIRNGMDVTTDNRSVVYLLKAPKAPVEYDHWLCGGALVSTEFIVTSAACVEDVQYFYAIAGYNKYVNGNQIDSDPCTRERKKKVVFICIPKTYSFDYDKVEKWAYDDIAVVKVESPYDFSDSQYARECSYTPAAIAINYDPKYQEPGIDGVVFGWGHREKWRQQNDTTDHNQIGLQFAAITLHDKNDCKRYYAHNAKMGTVIDKYMICSMGIGNLNDAGEPMTKPQLLDGCVTRMQRMAGLVGPLCAERNPIEELMMIDETRKQLDFVNNEKMTSDDNSTFEYRRNGICQNDHGGPLVTWVGAHQMLIGVASVFRVNNRSECEGPYLFTSTQCNGAFLHCILSKDKNARRELCKAPLKEKGFDMIERQISWHGHPDGPADNERQQFDNEKSIFRPKEVEKHQMEQQYNRPVNDREEMEQRYLRPTTTERVKPTELFYRPTLTEKPKEQLQQFYRPTAQQRQQMDLQFEKLDAKATTEDDKISSIEREIDSFFNFNSH